MSKLVWMLVPVYRWRPRAVRDLSLFVICRNDTHYVSFFLFVFFFSILCLHHFLTFWGNLALPLTMSALMWLTSYVPRMHEIGQSLVLFWPDINKDSVSDLPLFLCMTGSLMFFHVYTQWSHATGYNHSFVCLASFERLERRGIL